jgi:hypothetical protein
MINEWEVVDDSLHGVARGYLALVAYPPGIDGADPEREQRVDFIEDLRRFLAIHAPPEHRPADLQALPRRRNVERATDVGIGRIVDHAFKASWLGWAMLRGQISTPEEGLAELFRREGKRVYTSGAVRKVKQRKWKQRVPILHLAMPLIREMLGPPPEEGAPSLGGAGLAGQRLSRMVLEPRWVMPALLEADRWRLALPLGLEGLRVDDFLVVRVRRNKTGENLSVDKQRAV